MLASWPPDLGAERAAVIREKRVCQTKERRYLARSVPGRGQWSAMTPSGNRGYAAAARAARSGTKTESDFRSGWVGARYRSNCWGRPRTVLPWGQPIPVVRYSIESKLIINLQRDRVTLLSN